MGWPTATQLARPAGGAAAQNTRSDAIVGNAARFAGFCRICSGCNYTSFSISTRDTYARLGAIQLSILLVC